MGNVTLDSLNMQNELMVENDWDALDDVPETVESTDSEEGVSDTTEPEVKEEVVEETSDDIEDSVETEEVKEEKEDIKDKSEEPVTEEVEAEKTEEVVEDTFKVTVEGEEVDVSLQDLKNNYSGKVAYDKKFSELDVERKHFKQEVREINKYINDFSSKMRDGNVVGAFQYFGEFANIPPYMIKEQLIAALKPEFERRIDLSATEMQNEYLAQQNEYLNKQNESATKRRSVEANRQELLQTINGIRKAHAIDDAEWNSALDGAEANLTEGQQLTPALVQDHILHNRANTSAIAALEGVDKALATNNEWVSNLSDVIFNNPSFTDEDIKKVVDIALKESGYVSTETKLKEKIQKTEKSVSPSKQVKQKEEPTPSDNDLEEFFS